METQRENKRLANPGWKMAEPAPEPACDIPVTAWR